METAYKDFGFAHATLILGVIALMVVSRAGQEFH